MRWIGGIVIAVLILLVLAAVVGASISLSADKPGRFETAAITRIKYWRIGGKNQANPSPDTPETVKTGAEHFEHHCGVCHGLDGQNTGVPFAGKTSPRIANLASARVQKYTDGQLKWIIDNGIRFSGMPGWKGILEDDESWAIVRYLRHLPARGSLGIPAVYREAEEEHEHAEHPGEGNTPNPSHPAAAPAQPPHSHAHPH